MTSPPPPLATVKITLLGDASTGKTSLRQRFIDGGFSGSYRATIGCDFLSRRLGVEEEEGEGEVEMQVWDTAGQERFRSLAPAFYRNSQACILFYTLSSTSVSPSQVSKHLKSWFREFADKCPVGAGFEDREGLREFTWVCVGTKADELAGEEEMGVEQMRRLDKLQEEVEKTLEVLLPRLPPSASSRERGAAPPERGQEERREPPRAKVDVLPPPLSPSQKKKAERRLSKPPAIDPTSVSSTTAEPTYPPPPSSSSIPPSTPSTSPSTSSSIPLPSPPPTTNPNLLTSTSPPPPPPHFGDKGAPPGVWVGGPYTAEEGATLGVALPDRVEGGPDHRGDGERWPMRSYVPSPPAQKTAGEMEREADGEERGSEADEEYEYGRDGVKHFKRTSAKTGEGIEQVFEYIARRSLYHLRRQEQRQRQAGPSSAASTGQGRGVIKVNEHTKKSFKEKVREGCCT